MSVLNFKGSLPLKCTLNVKIIAEIVFSGPEGLELPLLDETNQ